VDKGWLVLAAWISTGGTTPLSGARRSDLAEEAMGTTTPVRIRGDSGTVAAVEPGRSIRFRRRNIHFSGQPVSVERGRDQRPALTH